MTEAQRSEGRDLSSPLVRRAVDAARSSTSDEHSAGALRRARRWHVVIVRVLDDNKRETVEADVVAPTAQAALRQLVLTSTENSRVVSIHVDFTRYV